jgi:hypothetical protein
MAKRGPTRPRAYPIETAPRDGTLVWLIDATDDEPYWGPGFFIDGKWFAGHPDRYEEEFTTDMLGNEDGSWFWESPTHWSPMPVIPARTGRMVN